MIKIVTKASHSRNNIYILEENSMQFKLWESIHNDKNFVSSDH